MENKLIIGSVLFLCFVMLIVVIAKRNQEHGFSEGYSLGYEAASK